MSVRESLFQSKVGVNIFDPVVIIDRKAVNSAEPQHCCDIQCQVASPSLGEIMHISNCLAESVKEKSF